MTIKREQRSDTADFRLGNIVFLLLGRKSLEEIFSNRGSRGRGLDR